MEPNPLETVCTYSGVPKSPFYFFGRERFAELRRSVSYAVGAREHPAREIRCSVGERLETG